MTTTHTMASSTFLADGSFWEAIWWLGMAAIALICLSSIKGLGLGRTIILGLSLTIAWVPLFAILCLMGMMLGAASESYVEHHGSSTVEISHVDTDLEAIKLS